MNGRYFFFFFHMANLNQYFESFVEIQFCQFLNGQNEASFIREKVKKVVIAC